MYHYHLNIFQKTKWSNFILLFNLAAYTIVHSNSKLRLRKITSNFLYRGNGNRSWIAFSLAIFSLVWLLNNKSWYRLLDSEIFLVHFVYFIHKCDKISSFWSYLDFSSWRDNFISINNNDLVQWIITNLYNILRNTLVVKLDSFY